MAAEGIERIIADLARREEEYRCDPDVAARLRAKELVAVIGPAGVGKSTVMGAAHAQDKGFNRVIGFTTRPRRPREPEWAYTFLPHSTDQLRRVHMAVVQRQLVQFAVHPHTGSVYGTSPNAYKQRYPMIDVLSSAVDGLESLPVKAIHKFFLVTSPAQYRARMDIVAARSASPEEPLQRLHEAKDSLAWAFEHETEVQWLANDGRSASVTAHDMIVRTKEPADDYRARYTGELMLKEVETHIRRLEG